MDIDYIEYILIFIIILMFIYYTFLNKDINKKGIKEEIDNEKLINSIPYLTPDAIVKQSNVKGGGRGVFSTRYYNVGEIIEVCPCIKQQYKYNRNIMSKYVFNYDDKYSIIAFGFCSMYNHKDNNNAEWIIVNKDQMKIVALKNIKPGEEIFISYGPDYFDDHGITMK